MRADNQALFHPRLPKLTVDKGCELMEFLGSSSKLDLLSYPRILRMKEPMLPYPGVGCFGVNCDFIVVVCQRMLNMTTDGSEWLGTSVLNWYGVFMRRIRHSS